MPTEKPRITFMISEERLAELETYRFDNKIKNQSQAIISLIEKGLSSLEAEKAAKTKNPPGAAEAEPGDDVQKMLEVLDGLLVKMGYIAAGDDLTEQQQEVLVGICGILRATFKKK